MAGIHTNERAKELLDRKEISQASYDKIVQQNAAAEGDTDFSLFRALSVPHFAARAWEGYKGFVSDASDAISGVAKAATEVPVAEGVGAMKKAFVEGRDASRAERLPPQQNPIQNAGLQGGQTYKTGLDEANAEPPPPAQPPRSGVPYAPTSGSTGGGGGGGFGAGRFSADMQAGYKKQMQAEEEIAKNARNAAIAQQSYYDQRATDEAEMQRQAVEKEQARQDALAARQQTIEQAIEDYSSTKIEPGRLWANASTGDKIVAGIGLFLGAFGSGGNKAVEVIDRAIQTDIDAQKANLQAKGESIRMQRGVFADMVTRFGDERQAEEASRNIYYKIAESKLRSMAAKFSGPDALAKAERAIGELQTRSAESQANLHMKAEELQLQRESLRRKSTPSGLQPVDPTDQLISQIGDPKERERAYAEANKFRDAQGLKSALDKTFGVVKGKKAFYNLPNGGDQAAVNAFNTDMFPAVKRVLGEAIQKSDAELTLNSFQLARSDTPAAVEEKMKGLRSFIDKYTTTPTLDRYGLGMRPKTTETLDKKYSANPIQQVSAKKD